MIAFTLYTLKISTISANVSKNISIFKYNRLLTDKH